MQDPRHSRLRDAQGPAGLCGSQAGGSMPRATHPFGQHAAVAQAAEPSRAECITAGCCQVK